MKAREYAPAGPLDQEPAGPYVPPEQRIEALHDALDGIPLGAHDWRIVNWLTSVGDDATCRTVVSLILRAREAGTP